GGQGHPPTFPSMEEATRGSSLLTALVAKRGIHPTILLPSKHPPSELADDGRTNIICIPRDLMAKRHGGCLNPLPASAHLLTTRGCPQEKWEASPDPRPQTSQPICAGTSIPDGGPLNSPENSRSWGSPGINRPQGWLSPCKNDQATSDSS